MKEVFRKNNYIDKFESVFGETVPENILNGLQHSVALEIDMQSEYLRDQPGNFWYETSHTIALTLVFNR